MRTPSPLLSPEAHLQLYRCDVAFRMLTPSRGFLYPGEAEPRNASFSFHLLTKLSWQALHFRLTPKKTCAVFCEACIQGVTAALVSPRQFTPTRKPSGSVASVGLISLFDELIVGQVRLERWDTANP